MFTIGDSHGKLKCYGQKRSCTNLDIDVFETVQSIWTPHLLCCVGHTCIRWLQTHLFLDHQLGHLYPY